MSQTVFYMWRTLKGLYILGFWIHAYKTYYGPITSDRPSVRPSVHMFFNYRNDLNQIWRDGFPRTHLPFFLPQNVPVPMQHLPIALGTRLRALPSSFERQRQDSNLWNFFRLLAYFSLVKTSFYCLFLSSWKHVIQKAIFAVHILSSVTNLRKCMMHTYLFMSICWCVLLHFHYWQKWILT